MEIKIHHIYYRKKKAYDHFQHYSHAIFDLFLLLSKSSWSQRDLSMSDGNENCVQSSLSIPTVYPSGL